MFTAALVICQTKALYMIYLPHAEQLHPLRIIHCSLHRLIQACEIMKDGISVACVFSLNLCFFTVHCDTIMKRKQQHAHFSNKCCNSILLVSNVMCFSSWRPFVHAVCMVCSCIHVSSLADGKMCLIHKINFTFRKTACRYSVNLECDCVNITWTYCCQSVLQHSNAQWLLYEPTS